MLANEYVSLVQEIARAFAPLRCVFDGPGSDYVKWVRFIVTDQNDKPTSL